MTVSDKVFLQLDDGGGRLRVLQHSKWSSRGKLLGENNGNCLEAKMIIHCSKQ